MTYAELLDYLKSLEENDDSRLEDGVKVWDMEEGEYYPTDLLEIEESDGIINAGHLFFGFGL